MKIPFTSIAALLLALLVPSVALATSELRIEGETTLTLENGFGLRAVQPTRVTVPAYEWIKVSVTGGTMSGYSWYKDGRMIPDATGETLFIQTSSSADSGTYYYAPAGSTAAPTLTSQKLELNVRPATTLLNLSTRGFVGPGDKTMITGFIVGGRGLSTVLIRAVGPSLARFGVTGVLSEPKLTIYGPGGRIYPVQLQYPTVGYSDKADHIQKVTAKLGAFPLDSGAKDAVDIRPFPPGAYTVQVTSADGTSSGNILLELYEVQENNGAVTGLEL